MGRHDTIVSPARRFKTIELLQFASMDISARFNALRIETDYMVATGYAGFGLVRTPINDTIQGLSNDSIPIIEDRKTVLNSLKYFQGITFRLKSTSNFGVDLRVEYQTLNLNSDNFKQTWIS